MLTFALDARGARLHVDADGAAGECRCPVCGSPLVARRGKVVRHHFAHKGTRTCADTWEKSYDDTEWAAAWQERFPDANREVALGEPGSRHRADVLAGRTVVEFQGRELPARQFNERNRFFCNMGYKAAWLVDLRAEFASGALREEEGRGRRLAFTWERPRKALSSYDMGAGDIDLYFQLRDGGEECIVRVVAGPRSSYGAFEALGWMGEGAFLDAVGRSGGSFPAPDMDPFRVPAALARFQERFGLSLNREQARAVAEDAGPTLLLAVPGSGKTTALVARLGYLVHERGAAPGSVVALTYTRAAARDMRERFAAAFGDGEAARRIRFSTINALAYGICRDWHEEAGLACPRQIGAKEKSDLLAAVFREVRGEFPSDSEVAELDKAVGKAKNDMWGARELAEVAREYDGFDEMYAAYGARLKDAGLMDFDDQMALALRVLGEDRGLLARYRSRYRHWLVDEAQDTSRLQHNLIYRLAGPRADIFMVGDEDQSIYGFRGAYPKAMFDFKYAYGGARLLKMEANYRSRPEIVDAARGFVSANKGRFDKDMRAVRGPGGEVGAIDVAGRLAQYGAVYEAVRARTGTMGVLYRDNDTAVPLVDRLLRDGEPFTMLSGRNSSLDASSVLDVKAFLSLSVDPRDEEAFMRVYRKASCYVRKSEALAACELARRGGRGLLDALVEVSRREEAGSGALRRARDFKATVRGLSGMRPLDAIDELLAGGYGDYLDEKRSDASKLDLLRPIAEQEESVRSFLERLDYLEGVFADPAAHAAGGGLYLASVHSAKGLEFDSVLVIDAVDGVFPSAQKSAFEPARDARARYQEERRLFYVAMTRARESVRFLRPLDCTTSFIDEVVPRSDACARPPEPARPHPAARAVVPVGHGVCTECGEVKPVSQLVDRQRGGGLVTGTCRSCYSRAVVGLLKRRAGVS